MKPPGNVRFSPPYLQISINTGHGNKRHSQGVARGEPIRNLRPVESDERYANARHVTNIWLTGMLFGAIQQTQEK